MSQILYVARDSWELTVLLSLPLKSSFQDNLQKYIHILDVM